MARRRYLAKRDALLVVYRERYANGGREAYQKAKQDPRFVQKRRENWARYYAENKRDLALNKARRRRYGLTHAEYLERVSEQGGRCAACACVPPAWPNPKRLVVDRDHETGVVRGLLCPGCNIGIGHLGDSPARLHLAAMYLVRHKRIGEVA